MPPEPRMTIAEERAARSEARRNRPKAEPPLLRFDRVERTLHWVNATLFGILMLTGAALYAGPISALVGNREIVRTLHVYSGLALPIPLLVAVIGRPGARCRPPRPAPRPRCGTGSCGRNLGHVNTAAAVAAARADLDRARHELEALVRIPSISANPVHDADVDACAAAVATLMRDAGLDDVRELRVGDGHPYVVGEWTHRADAPTVLLYAHHDVQPAGYAQRR